MVEVENDYDGRERMSEHVKRWSRQLFGDVRREVGGGRSLGPGLPAFSFRSLFLAFRPVSSHCPTFSSVTSPSCFAQVLLCLAWVVVEQGGMVGWEALLRSMVHFAMLRGACHLLEPASILRHSVVIKQPYLPHSPITAGWRGVGSAGDLMFGRSFWRCAGTRYFSLPLPYRQKSTVNQFITG